MEPLKTYSIIISHNLACICSCVKITAFFTYVSFKKMFFVSCLSSWTETLD